MEFRGDVEADSGWSVYEPKPPWRPHLKTTNCSASDAAPKWVTGCLGTPTRFLLPFCLS